MGKKLKAKRAGNKARRTYIMRDVIILTGAVVLGLGLWELSPWLGKVFAGMALIAAGLIAD